MDELTTINYEGITLLLIDDDKEIIDSTSSKLEDLGFKVICADNGRKAVEIVKEQKVDIIIIDYYMPDFTGEDAVKEIRKFNPRVVILLQTGYAGKRPPLKTLEELEIQGYHDKTRGFDELVTWVLSCVRICEQQKEVEDLYKEINLTNTSIEDFKREQLLLVNETKLATLGCLTNGIPETFNFYSDQIVSELFNLENGLKTYSNYLAEGKELKESDHYKIIQQNLSTLTSAKKHLDNIEKVINFIEQKDSSCDEFFECSKRITYDDLLVKFVNIIKLELKKNYNCEFNFIEKAFCGIDKYEFKNDTNLILEILQNIAINCVNLVHYSNGNNLNIVKDQKYLECFDLKRGVINFNLVAETFIDELNSRALEFQISIPNNSISEEAKLKILDDCKNGGIGLGLFTAQLVLKEYFNGKVYFKEIDEKIYGGGILFGVIVPVNEVVFNVIKSKEVL